MIAVNGRTIQRENGPAVPKITALALGTIPEFGSIETFFC